MERAGNTPEGAGGGKGEPGFLVERAGNTPEGAGGGKGEPGFPLKYVIVIYPWISNIFRSDSIVPPPVH